MADPVGVMNELDRLAREIDQRSTDLANCERQLVPVEDAYEQFMENFIAGMFEDQDGGRLPGEDVRRALAHKQLRKIDAGLLGSHRELTRRRKRLEKRLGSLKTAVDAQRSILSALKTELESVGGGWQR